MHNYKIFVAKCCLKIHLHGEYCHTTEHVNFPKSTQILFNITFVRGSGKPILKQQKIYESSTSDQTFAVPSYGFFPFLSCEGEKSMKNIQVRDSHQSALSVRGSQCQCQGQI